MKKVKVFASGFVFLCVLLLSSCTNTTVVVSIEECYGGSDGIVECEVRLVFRRKSALISNFDDFAVSQPRINLTQSNVSLASNSGNFILSIKTASGSLVASHSFAWFAAGDYIYPSDPVGIQLWLESNFKDGDTIEYNLGGLSFTGGTGSNVVIAILEFGDWTLGASDSFYLNVADLNGF